MSLYRPQYGNRRSEFLATQPPFRKNASNTPTLVTGKSNALEQRLKEMDISVSFVESPSAGSDKSGELRVDKSCFISKGDIRDKKSPTGKKVVQMEKASENTSSNRRSNGSDDLSGSRRSNGSEDLSGNRRSNGDANRSNVQFSESPVSESEIRLFVLSIIGKIHDARMLEPAHIGELIRLAMLSDGTVKLMHTLIQARPTISGQADFLKLWLDSMAGCPGETLACKAELPKIVRPKPTRSNEDHCAPITLRGSPPLCPTVLQFNDPIYGVSKSLTSSSGSLHMGNFPQYNRNTTTDYSSSCSTNSTPFDQ